MENEIKLLKNNDKKDWSDIEWIREFFNYLKGEEPETIKSKQPLNLSSDEAFSVIWYLQEHFSVFPDTIEKCDNCGELFDDAPEGIYSEEGNEIGHHFCGNCYNLAPYENDEENEEVESETEFLDVFEKAEETKEWLEGTNNDDLFNDYSAIIQR